MDSHLDLVRLDGDAARRPGSLELQVLTSPGVGAPVLVSQPPRDRLGETSRASQAPGGGAARTTISLMPQNLYRAEEGDHDKVMKTRPTRRSKT